MLDSRGDPDQRVRSAGSSAGVIVPGPTRATAACAVRAWIRALAGAGTPVQPRQQGDLAVEEVGLHTGAAAQALPGRSAGARIVADRAQLKVVGTAGVVLLLGDRVDAGRHEHGLRLGVEQVQALEDVVAGQLCPAEHLHGVPEVVQQLAVLPAHDVGPRLAFEPRSVSWLLAAWTTTSSCRQSTSRGWAYAAIRNVTRSSGVSKLNPCSRMAVRWEPRAIRATS